MTHLLRYRSTGGQPPPDHELLTIDEDGRFTMWRSIGRASSPPSPVGSFAGTMDVAELRSLGTAPRGNVELPLPSDAATEVIDLGHSRLVGPNGGRVPQDWEPLVSYVRGLLGSLTGSPLAALGLSVDPSALVHLGPDALRVDFSRASVRAVRWDGAAVVDSWEGRLDVPATEVGPDWSMPVPADPRFVDAPSIAVTVEVEGFAVHDGEQWRACALTTPTPV